MHLLRLRPNSEKLAIYRKVICFWCRSMGRKQMQTWWRRPSWSPTAWTNRVCDAVSSFPQVFHAAMVEDLRSMDAEEANVAMEKQIEEADNRLWAAKQQSFETLLKRDLQTIERASRGHSHLKDRLLDIVKLVLFFFFQHWNMRKAHIIWGVRQATIAGSCPDIFYSEALFPLPLQDQAINLANACIIQTSACWRPGFRQAFALRSEAGLLAMKKRLAQVDTADSLVKAYLKWFCKDVRAATLNDIVPECASAAKDVPPLVPPPSTSAFVAVGKHVVMLKIDLNVPNVNRHIIICLFVFGNLH